MKSHTPAELYKDEFLGTALIHRERELFQITSSFFFGRPCHLDGLRVGCLSKAVKRSTAFSRQWQPKVAEVRYGMLSYEDHVPQVHLSDYLALPSPSAMLSSSSTPSGSSSSSSIASSSFSMSSSTSVLASASSAGHSSSALLAASSDPGRGQPSTGHKVIPLRSDITRCRAVDGKHSCDSRVFEVCTVGAQDKLFLASSREDRDAWLCAISAATVIVPGRELSRKDRRKSMKGFSPFLLSTPSATISASRKRRPSISPQQAHDDAFSQTLMHSCKESLAGPASLLAEDVLVFVTARAKIAGCLSPNTYKDFLRKMASQNRSVRVPVVYVKAAFHGHSANFSAVSGDVVDFSSPTSPRDGNGVSSSATVSQLCKDMQRDCVCVNGTMLSGEMAGGVLGIFNHLTAILRSHPRGLGDSAHWLSESDAAACARDILVLCNRTQSGGDTYYCVEALLARCGLDCVGAPDDRYCVLSPASCESEPLSMSVQYWDGGKYTDCSLMDERGGIGGGGDGDDLEIEEWKPFEEARRFSVAFSCHEDDPRNLRRNYCKSMISFLARSCAVADADSSTEVDCLVTASSSAFNSQFIATPLLNTNKESARILSHCHSSAPNIQSVDESRTDSLSPLSRCFSDSLIQGSSKISDESFSSSSSDYTSVSDSESDGKGQDRKKSLKSSKRSSRNSVINRHTSWSSEISSASRTSAQRRGTVLARKGSAIRLAVSPRCSSPRPSSLRRSIRSKNLIDELNSSIEKEDLEDTVDDRPQVSAAKPSDPSVTVVSDTPIKGIFGPDVTAMSPNTCLIHSSARRAPKDPTDVSSPEWSTPDTALCAWDSPVPDRPGSVKLSVKVSPMMTTEASPPPRSLFTEPPLPAQASSATENGTAASTVSSSAATASIDESNGIAPKRRARPMTVRIREFDDIPEDAPLPPLEVEDADPTTSSSIIAPKSPSGVMMRRKAMASTSIDRPPSSTRQRSISESDLSSASLMEQLSSSSPRGGRRYSRTISVVPVSSTKKKSEGFFSALKNNITGQFTPHRRKSDSTPSSEVVREQQTKKVVSDGAAVAMGYGNNNTGGGSVIGTSGFASSMSAAMSALSSPSRKNIKNKAPEIHVPPHLLLAERDGEEWVRVRVRALSEYKICCADPQGTPDDDWANIRATFSQDFLIYKGNSSKIVACDRMVTIFLVPPASLV